MVTYSRFDYGCLGDMREKKGARELFFLCIYIQKITKKWRRKSLHQTGINFHGD